MAEVKQLEAFKFVVGTVLIEKDAAGKITGESETQPVTVYGLDELGQWVRDFPKALKELQAEAQRQADEIEAAKAKQPNRAARRKASTRKKTAAKR